MIKKRVSIPIYFGDLVIIYDENGWENTNKLYSRNLDNKTEAVVFNNVKKSGFIEYVVVFTKLPQSRTIAHECVHLVNFLYIDRGVELDRYNDEPQAYLIGWFYEEIEKFFSKINSKN